MADEDDESLTDHATNMRVDVAVLKVKVGSIDKKLDGLLLSLSTGFATKGEVAVVVDDVRALKQSQAWVLKLIVGAVLLAVIGMVLVKGGVPHG